MIQPEVAVLAMLAMTEIGTYSNVLTCIGKCRDKNCGNTVAELYRVDPLGQQEPCLIAYGEGDNNLAALLVAFEQFQVKISENKDRMDEINELEELLKLPSVGEDDGAESL